MNDQISVLLVDDHAMLNIRGQSKNSKLLL
jgi:hypothetical protein